MYSRNSNAGFDSASIDNDFAGYAKDIATTFPDSKGGFVPVNMGEFGVSSKNGGSGISEQQRARWTDAVIAAAERQGFSWHYWGFAGVGGFEAYGSSWYSEIKAVFDKYISRDSAVK